MSYCLVTFFAWRSRKSRLKIPVKENHKKIITEEVRQKDLDTCNILQNMVPTAELYSGV